MANAIFSALKYLPASVARKALVKVDPRFGKYFSKVISYGLDANRALDYLSDRFSNPAQKSTENMLEQRQAQGMLRPDEMLSKSEMGKSKIPGKLLKSAASFATGGLLGGMEGDESEQPRLSNEEKREAALQEFKGRLKKKKPISELSREALMRQFEESEEEQQARQGKGILLSTMRQINQSLREMRGQGG